MKRLVSFLYMYWVLGLALVLVVGGVVFYARPSGKEETYLTVRQGPFLQQVSVSGKVIASQQVDLGFSQSGRVAGVYVKEGKAVTEGTLIAEIENGDLRASVLQKQAALDSQKAKLAALKRGTRPEELAVAQSSVASAEASVAQARQAVVDAIVSAFSKADSGVHVTVDQFISNPRSVNPQLNFNTSNNDASRALITARVQIEPELALWQSELLTLTASSDLSKAVQTAQSRLALTNTVLANASVALSSALTTNISQTTLDTYGSNVSTARTSVNTAISTLTTALTALRSSENALDIAKKDLALKQAGATAEDILSQEAIVKVAEADVVQANAQLIKTQIRAPFTGTVTKILAKVGEIVSPGVPQASVIGSGLYEIESYVPEINVALVRQGNTATVTFDSYGENVQFTAKVVTVDLGETLRDGVSTYRTLLVFDKNDDRIRSGMTANVIITTAEKQNVISIPQKLVKNNGATQVVDVQEGDSVVERVVTTGGTSSLGDIEILSGLKDGDVLVIPGI